MSSISIEKALSAAENWLNSTQFEHNSMVGSVTSALCLYAIAKMMFEEHKVNSTFQIMLKNSKGDFS
jgi:hypothetical protein